MASASSSALAASIIAMAASAASASAANAASAARCCHTLGRRGRAQRLRNKPFAAARLRQAATTASRSIPMRASSACSANCGCPGAPSRPRRCAGASGRSRRRRSCRHESASRSVSRPGSTTAPCGKCAMVAISSAVAGIEPVEPAAITGASVLRASRAASALISASRRAAGSIAPRSRSIAGHVSRAICRNFSVSCQYGSRIVGHEPVERVPRHLAHGHVVDQAREIVGERAGRRRRLRDERGALRCREPPARAPIRSTSRVSSSRRSRPPSAGGKASASAAMSPAAASAKAISSSSMSPIATMRGRIAASAVEPVEKSVARQPAGAPRRQIERHGGERERIAQRRESRACRRSDASISVGRNGADGGMVKTRGGIGRIVSQPRVVPADARTVIRRSCATGLRGYGQIGVADSTARRRARFRGGDRVGRADVHPDAFEPQPEQAARSSPARSNSSVSEKAPLGASANSAGESIAAPA